MINIHEAKTHLSRLVDEANEGKEIIIAKAGRPMARLVSVRRGRKRRRLGPLAGRFSIPEDFDAPLPDKLVATFEGRGEDAPAR
jgi:prevent-host-death family protein